MKSVVMLGPSPASKGGIASVIATLLAHGYADTGRCRFIATQVDGSAWRKAARAGIALAHCSALLGAGRVSLLHVHVASGASFWRKAAFIAAARTARCPVLFHLHGGEFCQFVDQRLSGASQRAAVALIASCAAAFALTGESAAWLRQRCRVPVVEVFPNPVAVASVLPRAPGNAVLFIGRLDERKGVFDLLRAFAALAATRPAARLVLAGEGDSGAVLALARTLGVVDQLSLPGWVGARQRAALLASAAVFVLPSHTEQMPMSLLEAMAAGTPVIASDVGAMPHMLGHGRCGLVIPAQEVQGLAAAIARMLDDHLLARTLSACALERVKAEFQVDAVLARLRRRYQELAV